jgi:hypothetical protein
MKRFTDFLRVLGFGFLLVLSTAVLDSNANGGCSPKSPLRGTWGWYQFRFFIPSGSSTPLAGTEAGNMRVDECGDIMGHAFFNFPLMRQEKLTLAAPVRLLKTAYLSVPSVHKSEPVQQAREREGALTNSTVSLATRPSSLRML